MSDPNKLPPYTFDPETGWVVQNRGFCFQLVLTSPDYIGPAMTRSELIDWGHAIARALNAEREARPDAALRATLHLTIGFLAQLKDRFSNDGSNDFHWPKWVTPEYRKLLTQRVIAETRNPDEDVSGSCVDNTSVVYGLINHLKELAGPAP